MKFKLTRHIQFSHTDKDGKNRNHIIYFLNGIKILKQKYPFDERWERGFDRRIVIYDEYILNKHLHQKRRKWNGCSHPDNEKEEIRNVSFPLSGKKLKELGVKPEDFIKISYED